MLARVRSAAVLGVDAYPVEVEVDLSNGLPSLSTVGLPQSAVKEGRERVHAAIVNAGFEFPLRRITINLAPADRPKAGSGFDLAIALGILVASGQVPPGALAELVVLGEIGLEGDVRPVRGALPVAQCARANGARCLVVPAPNAPEAALVEGLEVRAAASLSEVCGFLAGRVGLPLARADVGAALRAAAADSVDFAEVRSQAVAKRALEIAAAGGHNLLKICSAYPTTLTLVEGHMGASAAITLAGWGLAFAALLRSQPQSRRLPAAQRSEKRSDTGVSLKEGWHALARETTPKRRRRAT